MRSLLGDFLKQIPPTQEFFEHPYRTQADRMGVVQKVIQRPLHPTVLKLLEHQNQAAHPQAQASLNKLRGERVSVAVTGQQLGLFGGPLFTLYKIASCVGVAAALERESGTPCVPIFWLQSEDHDFKEIQSTSLFSKDNSLLEVALDDQSPGYRDCVGDIVISPEESRRLADFLNANFGHPFHPPVRDLLLASYGAGSTLAQALARLVQGIFGAYGVLVFDPNNRTTKELVRELISTSFLRVQGIQRVLEERSAWLTSHGYEVQVPTKKNSPLYFFSIREPNGIRARVRLTEGVNATWVSDNLTLSKEDLFHVLDREPERFTSSALSRPIMQDTLFPTAAYICGPTEFNYWVQLTPLYRFFGISQPLVVPRASFVIFEERHVRLMEKNDLSFADLQHTSEDFIKRRYQHSTYDPDPLFSALRSDIDQRLQTLAPLLTEIDANMLLPALETTASSIAHNLEKFKAKYLKALANREALLTSYFDRLKQIAFPLATPQERVISFAYPLLAHGPAFIDQIITSLTPWEEVITKVLVPKGIRLQT